jgi:hypothetical protein
MSEKMIKISVPIDWQVPDILNTFSPDENALILSMGSNIIKEARRVVAGLSEKEIYNKIHEQSKEEIKKLEVNLLVQKELNSCLDKSIRYKYDSQIEQMNKQIDELKKKIYNYEFQNKDLIKLEVEREREKYAILLEQKEKQVNKINETHELILKQNHKSTAHKGQEGEQVFEYYADETFRDFKGYSLTDKHTQGGAGDFHLQFEEFDVLVDAKNYKKKVPIDQRDKIKNDLIKNEHLTFAWLVSLNTSIDKYDKSPIMYEWINTKQCIVYINNLIECEDPRKLLRIVWFTCKELCKFVQDLTENDEELKNNKFKLMDKIKNTRKRIREINTSLNNTKNLIQLMDEELKEVLLNETEELVESNYGIFDEWWETNIELTNDEETSLLSTEMWGKFKNDNKKLIKENEITIEKFKQFIKTKVCHSNIIFKSKSINTAYEIKGIKFKEINPIVNKKLGKEEIDNKMVLVLDEMPIIKSKEKIVKNKFYFNEEKDNKIIKEYMIKKEDIMKISSANNIKPWEVVSLLVKYKMIIKRDEARGYDQYKETEEYQNKLIKK